MKIVCLGAGRLAHQLMPQLHNSGHEIVQVYNRSKSNAGHLAKILSCEFTISIEDIREDADIYFLAVADDAITAVAHQLKFGDSFKGIVTHSSGVLPIDVIPFKNRGIFYPLQSFSQEHAVDWNTTPILITAETKELNTILENLAKTLTTYVYRISDEQKSVLHVAAVFANNFSNHMLKIAEDICVENDVSFSILKPLITTTYQKALAIGPEQSQTGPAIRGDEATIEKHLDFLNNHPSVKEIYRMITAHIRQEE